MESNKVLFCQVAWYARYDGWVFCSDIDQDDDWDDEMYNFYNYEGIYYGYSDTNLSSRGFDLDRIDKYHDHKKVEDVTIIFFAIDPNTKQRLIVGVYENACVYAKAYRMPFDNRTYYNISTNAWDGFLIPVHLRTISLVPSTNTFKLTKDLSDPIWYLDELCDQLWLQGILDQLEQVKPLCRDIKWMHYEVFNQAKTNQAVQDILATNIAINPDTLKHGCDDIQVQAYALSQAHYVCAYDSTHQTFLRPNQTNYTEAHYLLPPYWAQDDLTSAALVVSLCPNCHQWIHQGRDNEVIIKKLYELKKDEWAKLGIKISLDRLLDIYKK